MSPRVYTIGAAPGSDTRPLSALPFAATSPWRLGIARTATFAADDDPRNLAMENVAAPGSVWVNWDQYSHSVTQARATDPIVPVTDTSHIAGGVPGGGTWLEQIPPTARIAGGTDAHMHVITPDGQSVQEHFATKRNADGSYTTRRRHLVSLTGSGIGPQNGTRAYGGSALGGLIRGWEVDPNPRYPRAIAHPRADVRPPPPYTGTIAHPLAIALRRDQLYYSGVTLPQDGHGATYNGAGYGLAQGYVWPATEQDYDSATTYKGAIPMGSYFAIPPGVDIATLTLATPQSRMVAKAAQDYGVYVTDAAGAAAFVVQDDGRPSTKAFADALRNAPAWTAADVRKILRALRVVTSNGPDSPNGGPLTADRRG